MGMGEKKQSGTLREHCRDDNHPERQPRSLASLIRLYFPGFLVGKLLPLPLPVAP